MSQDIVSEFVDQMNLTPAMADQLQNQQYSQGGMDPGAGGMGMGMGMGTGMGTGMALPTTPEEQMRLINSAQHPQSPPPPPLSQQQYTDEPAANDSYEISTASTSDTAESESGIDLEKVGLGGPQKTMMDSIFDYLKDPLLIIVLFVIISLTQVDQLIRRVLPALITGNVWYYLFTKAFLMGLTFLLSKLVIH